ncbi:hypothetical protein C2E20_8034 [Micractinium conductrix]|uniref:Uncharacterized protein n=1 Tax=Micractinium conductrix TaxID=554055 RepID=A0A2P6V2L2_9CHLO|nr:hypothetical protein C2E20_8034 [Micractinium conductrix]|eukprot:PSC68311.1 hypothetical protein C2E20_8034 [Micractinium conductrix]
MLLAASGRCAPAGLHLGAAGTVSPPRRRHHVTPLVRCSSQQRPDCGDPVHQQQESLAVLTLRTALLVVAVQAAAAAAPQAALAAGWQPRRHIQSHLRKHFVSEETPKQAAARKAEQRQAAAAQRAAAAAAAAEQEGQLSLQGVLGSAQRKLQQLWRQEPVYSVGINNRQAAYCGSRPPAASPYAWVPVALAGGAAALLLLGGRLRLPFGGERRGQGGRWVRDRSLGGKMVFIPDADLPEGGAKQPRPLWDDLDGDDGGATSAAAAAGSSGGSDGEAGPWATAAPPTPAAQPVLPSWWQSPNFAVYATFARKDELQRQARQVLRQLEDAKMLQGLDYPVSGLVSLRTLCQEAGGYQVKPRTESGRDAMLRAAVAAAMAAGQEGSFAMLGGDHPAKFVCGLAHDLGVPEQRAITIVHAEVAARCRAALIDAEAAFRAGNQADLLMALVKMAGALQTFPLPAGSAEAELVAAGVVKQTSLLFRKAIFLEIGAVSPQLAALAAELLGFNPDLVMPELARQLAAATAQLQQDAPQ